MTPEQSARVAAVRRSLPPVGALRFFVDSARPGYFRASATPPRGAGLYVVESWGPGAARARLLHGPERERWRHEGSSLDEAQSSAAQHAQKQIPKPQPLHWKRGQGERGKPEWHAHVTMPIWGRGYFALPRSKADQWAYWEGTEVWGHPWRSMLEANKRGLEAFVRAWRAMANRPARYYRVVPFRPQFAAYPPGAMRQAGVADVLELYYGLPFRFDYTKGSERQRAIWDAAQAGNLTAPTFRWDLKAHKKGYVPEPEGSAALAEHVGLFNTGQAFGYFEIVEYTTGKKPKVRSLGIWQAPTLTQWRKDTSRRPVRVDVEWARPETAQLAAAARKARGAAYPLDEPSAGAATQLAAEMVRQATAELELARATEQRRKTAALRKQATRAEKQVSNAVAALVAKFGGARAEQIRFEAQTMLEAHLHTHRKRLAYYSDPEYVELRGLPTIRLRMFEFGAPATRVELYAEARRRALAFGKRQPEIRLPSDDGFWTEEVGDGVRVDFLVSVDRHEPERTGQVGYGRSDRPFVEA